MLFSNFILSITFIATFHHSATQAYLSIILTTTVISFVVLVRKFVKQERLGFVGSFIAGFYTGPLGIVATLFRSGMLPKEKSAVKFGAVALTLLAVLFWYPYYVVEHHQLSNAIYVDLLFLSIFSIAVSSLIVLIHHHPRLPNVEKQTAGFFYQVWLFFIRGCIQQIREWKGVLFDLGLVVLAGGFLGIIFYNQPWMGTKKKINSSTKFFFKKKTKFKVLLWIHLDLGKIVQKMFSDFFLLYV